MRARHFSTYQLSWNVATGVSPLRRLVDSVLTWLGSSAIAMAGALMTRLMRRNLADTGRVVTNPAVTQTA